MCVEEEENYMSVNAMPDHSCNYVVINNRSWMENSSDVGLMRRGDGDNGIARSVASHGGHRLPTVCEDEKEENEECVEEEEEEEDGDDSEIVVAPLLMKSTSLCNYTSSACKDAKRTKPKAKDEEKCKWWIDHCDEAEASVPAPRKRNTQHYLPCAAPPPLQPSPSPSAYPPHNNKTVKTNTNTSIITSLCFQQSCNVIANQDFVYWGQPPYLVG